MFTSRQIRFSCNDFVLRKTFFFFPTLNKIASKKISIQLMAIDRFNITHITCKTISVFDMPRQNYSSKLDSL